MNILRFCVHALFHLFFLFIRSKQGLRFSYFEIKLRNLHGYSFGGKGLKS